MDMQERAPRSTGADARAALAGRRATSSPLAAMRTIGILGGMSWESTAEYYRLINEAVRDRLGGLHSARVIVDSVDFADVEALQAAGEWEAAGIFLAERAQALEAAGADLLVIATNTMHKVADAVAGSVGVPLVHIGDATAAVVNEAGVRRVGLLGTAFTMRQPFLSDRLRAAGIDVIVPRAEDVDVVHRVIYDELVVGIVRDESRARFRGVINRLVERGADGVILGCTEIELLVNQDDSAVPVFPTTRVHALAAVDAALS